MKKSRYTDSQILSILKQANSGIPVPQLCREHGMSSRYKKVTGYFQPKNPKKALYVRVAIIHNLYM